MQTSTRNITIQPGMQWSATRGHVGGGRHAYFSPLIGGPVRQRIPPPIELLWSVKDRLDRGKNVLIHCRQGIGRAGMIAAGVLILFGAASEDAVRAVSAERGVAIPETPQQMDWLRNLSSLRLAAPIPAQPRE